MVVLALWLGRSEDPDGASGKDRLAVERAGSMDRRAGIGMQVLGSIAGTVRDVSSGAIARARVCAESVAPQPTDELRDLACSQTDDKGHYRLDRLIAAEYAVHASAPQYRPVAYRPDPNTDRWSFWLAPGESRVGIDLVLRRGGVELTGTVLDLTGGPISQAQVRAMRQLRAPGGPPVESDAQGRFSLWVDGGPIWVSARADGYVPGRTWGRAPGTVELKLLPAASLAGIVTDAVTGRPVEGARVEIERVPRGEDGSPVGISDTGGKFRFQQLSPGRYVAHAAAAHGYGRAEGSVQVGLGQHVDGIAIRLFAAHRVTGALRAEAAQPPCPEGQVELVDRPHARSAVLRRQPDGELAADGVLPGSYAVRVRCTGYLPRDHYEPVIVADADVAGLVWQVDRGAGLRGKVVTRSGQPIEGASLQVQRTDGPGSTAGSTRLDGSFALSGLHAGSHRVFVEATEGVSPRDGFAVEIGEGATLERDFVLDDGGTLAGTIADVDGTPVADAEVFATADGAGTVKLGGNYVRSDATGAFVFDLLRAGDYRVTALRSWDVPLHRPGAAGDARPGEPVTIRAGLTATVKLVVERQRGAIRGTVVDAAGAPVVDGFVSSSLELEAASAQGATVGAGRDDSWVAAPPVLTATDGSFTLSQLSPGTYTVRATRKGGGEAVARHVRVGAEVQLQLQATGSVEGSVRRIGGPPPDELEVSLRDVATGFERTERYDRTGGHFMIRDLPAGHFEAVFAADTAHKAVAVDLQPGEAKTGLEITLDALVTVTGRLVEHGTHQPVPGLYVVVQPAGRSAGPLAVDPATAQVSDGAGRFAVASVPAGSIAVRGTPREPGSPYATFFASKTAVGTGTVDVGDVFVLRRRLAAGEAGGTLGLEFAAQPGDTPPELREYKIASIDPAGPAAKTALQVGDVIASCDGTDVTGANSWQWPVLVAAPPGTPLVLATRRGSTATVVLAAP